MASIQELDGRQRMINMMYIIFIAMQAMNMSKEVLTAFGDVNKGLTESIEQNEKANTLMMAGLSEKASEQPDKYGPLNEMAQDIEKTSNDLVSYLDEIKAELTEKYKPEEGEDWNFEQMDSDAEIDQLFFGGGKTTDKAKELKSKVDEFREQAIELAKESGNESLVPSIESKFSTDKVTDKEGAKIDWLNYHFEGFPLVAAVTKMTNIQSNAKQLQADLLSGMVSGQMESDVSMSNYEAIVVADKSAFFSGEDFTGKVILGRVDKSLNFSAAEINGNEIDKSDFEAGQVNLKFPAGNVGDQNIEGVLKFEEADSTVSIPINDKYSVIPRPEQAVISADKMNVVYRGVKNPMTISIPGIGSVDANAPGLSHKSGAEYEMDVTNVKAREVEIKVSGKMPDGETVSSSETFRIKDIPAPKGTVRGETATSGPLKMQKNGLKKSSVGAVMEDFDFDLNLSISGFKIQAPGKPVVEVSGTQMNGAAQQAIDDAPRGATINVFDIKASIQGNSSYHLPPPAPVMVQLSN